jgi:hypothetical protein
MPTGFYMKRSRFEIRSCEQIGIAIRRVLTAFNASKPADWLVRVCVQTSTLTLCETYHMDLPGAKEIAHITPTMQIKF